MTILISKIETLFLEGSLEAICFATIIYLTRKGTTILPLKDIKDFAERAVNSSLDKITDFERRMKVLEVLTQVCKLYTCFITMEITIYSDDFTANVIKSILRIITKS